MKIQNPTHIIQILDIVLEPILTTGATVNSFVTRIGIDFTLYIAPARVTINLCILQKADKLSFQLQKETSMIIQSSPKIYLFSYEPRNVCTLYPISRTWALLEIYHLNFRINRHKQKYMSISKVSILSWFMIKVQAISCDPHSHSIQ